MSGAADGWNLAYGQVPVFFRLRRRHCRALSAGIDL